jgi:translation initiation factor 4G
MTYNILYGGVQTEHPRAEDVECMCKLLTTVGRPMDASTRSTKQADDKGNVRPVTTADMMIIYFKRIESLSNNDALDTRHRFMLRDLIELRRNNWVLRRKVRSGYRCLTNVAPKPRCSA